MPFRKYASAPLDLHFREDLQRWAKKFVRSEVAAARIVERTISVLCDNPHLLDGPNINEDIFALLRRHAFDESDIASGPDTRRKAILVNDQTVPEDEAT